MPTRHDHDQASVLAEAREHVISDPVPDLLARDFGVRVSATFDWIIDHAEVERLTSDRSTDRGVAEVALVSDKFEHVVIA